MEKIKIPIISLHQPWAGFVALEAKEIETRIHDRFKCLNQRWVAIHSTKQYDKSIITSITDPIIKLQGSIICICFVKDVSWLNREHSERAMIDCFPIPFKRFGLFLTKVQLLKEPIKINGAQGIWYYKFTKEQLEGINITKPNQLL